MGIPAASPTILTGYPYALSSMDAAVVSQPLGSSGFCSSPSTSAGLSPVWLHLPRTGDVVGGDESEVSFGCVVVSA